MSKPDPLYGRAIDILERQGNGHALPILRKLAMRRYSPALAVLSDFESPARSLRLQRIAAATGDPTAMYNLSVEYLNRGNMSLYRYWLARAARIDLDAREELRTFRTRFPHENMRRLRRLCPAHL
ncbi:hypothetical protein [Sphingomonas sp. LT1P40]|uniref:hypothetical protein n=1 Tax=Alteristakelama amylovorans TaxID=3096166 RepID=UPI002FC5CBCD